MCIYFCPNSYDYYNLDKMCTSPLDYKIILHVIMDHTYMCIDLSLYDDSGYGDDERRVFTSDRVGVGVIIRSIE